ncbi:calcium-activated chloride channel regulator 4A [Biomphalaria glabrata]|nr:calcium-activated chloride channel regulator 4A [Biomphalaria glabrata]KAI8764124.1 calcium-activated chloride channel regulator 4A [Biomphalaria glabrata]
MSNDFEKLLTDYKSTSLLQNKHIIRGSLNSPKASGTVEELIVTLNETAIKDNFTLFMNIHAMDENGNKGDASNIISISFANETAVLRRNVEKPLSPMIYLAVCLPLALVGIIILIVAISLMVSRAKKSKSEDFEQAEQCTTHSVHSLDIENMNYMFDGEYRKRLPEEMDTWSRGSI